MDPTSIFHSKWWSPKHKRMLLHPYFIGEQCSVTDIQTEEMCLQSIKRTVTQYGLLQHNIGRCWMDVTSFIATRIIWSHNTKLVCAPMCGTRIIWSANIKLWCRCLCATLRDTHYYHILQNCSAMCVCVRHACKCLRVNKKVWHRWYIWIIQS